MNGINSGNCGIKWSIRKMCRIFGKQGRYRLDMRGEIKG